MDCTDHREQVSAFIDNELAPNSQTQLFDHLANCAQCHLFLDSLMKFKSMKNQEDLEFPSDVDAILFDEINRRKYVYSLGKSGLEVKAPFWQRRIALSLPTLAAMIAVIVIGISTLFVNFLAQGRGPKEQDFRGVAEERRIEKQETIVYGVPGVTVYGQPSQAEKTRL